MENNNKAEAQKPPAEKKPGIMHLLKPYRGLTLLLLVFTLLGNGINLLLPKITVEVEKAAVVQASVRVGIGL